MVSQAVSSHVCVHMYPITHHTHSIISTSHTYIYVPSHPSCSFDHFYLAYIHICALSPIILIRSFLPHIHTYMYPFTHHTHYIVSTPHKHATPHSFQIYDSNCIIDKCMYVCIVSHVICYVVIILFATIASECGNLDPMYMRVYVTKLVRGNRCLCINVFIYVVIA